MRFAVTPTKRVVIGKSLADHAENARRYGVKRSDFAVALLAITNTTRVETALKRLSQLVDPTCKLTGVSGYTGEVKLFYYEFSCGHSAVTIKDEIPRYCPDCGCRVRLPDEG